MVAKCGEVRVWHWAHKGRLLCDPWWENETEWHRAWKERFPADWQEIIHTAENGERHIADVKTDAGWVIEFQYSYIEPGERRSREAFYPKMIWVVDGTRRKRDRAQFITSLNDGGWVVRNAPLRKAFSDECRLLREWVGSHAAIFFDLGEVEALWYLLPNSNSWWAYVHPVSRAEFIEWHRSPPTEKARQFGGFVNDISKLVADYESRPRGQQSGCDPLRLPRPRRPFRF
jgi:hypothetical protein